jgi:hypothetical protein
MNDDAATIAQPLKNLLQGLAAQAPTELLPMLALFARRPVSEEDLVTFVETAPPNDPGMIQLRLALAKWDASEDLELYDEDGNETDAGTIARRVAVVGALGLSEQAEAILRHEVPVHVQNLIVITREFEPWYEEARNKRSTLYWDDYQEYVTQVMKWPASSITALDQSTNAVVERLTDPARTDIKPTKGLVVGYVQSGKTANFTGVIAKAVDAGYRLVIVMTGTSRSFAPRPSDASTWNSWASRTCSPARTRPTPRSPRDWTTSRTRTGLRASSSSTVKLHSTSPGQRASAA